MSAIEAPRFLLRWRLEYRDRPPKYSIWNMSGIAQSDQAWCQTRNGLSRAIIEAKDLVTREIKVIVDCPADIFRLFQWIAIQKLDFKSTRKDARNVGIALVTNDLRIEAYEWGQVIQRPLINGEQKVNFTSD
jgi:hypothetical protein